MGAMIAEAKRRPTPKRRSARYAAGRALCYGRGMRVEATPAGLFLPEAGLHLDPVLPVPVAAVSHGHRDHVPVLAGRMIATEETEAIVRARVGETETTRAVPREPLNLHLPGKAPARITLFPAGHVLGSAGVLVEIAGERLFYSGDVKLRPSLTCAPAEIPQCDTLVLESTFGLPVFRFPPVEELRRAIAAHARAAFDAGETPVFLAYALGKGPEVAKILGEAGIPVSLHGSIARMTKIYEDFGVVFPGAEAYETGALSGRALIVPPSCRNQPIVTKRKKSRVIAVTGWALLDAAYDRYGARGLVPLSDHGGYEELLRVAELSRASKVWTIHGFVTPLARALAARGIDARPLPRPSGDSA
jgi:putative mRNA 3-end processing factor